MTLHDNTENEALGELAWLVETEGRIWAIRPEMLNALRSMKASSGALDAAAAFVTERLAAEDGLTPEILAARGRGRPAAINGGVAVLPLKGVLMPQVSLLAALFGLGSSLASFRVSLAQAVADPDVGAIVLDIDSPGGLVDHIPETAEEVRAAQAIKPVVAVSNTLCASAAYWIGSQAGEFVVTPSGEVGSIGVYAEHQDVSKAMESAGMKSTLISAGKYKTEGNPYEPLTSEARSAIQAGVDDYYSLFVKDVATGREATVSEVKSGYGEGRVLTAKRAVDAKLADRVDTLDGVVSGLLKRSRSTSDGSSALLAGDEERKYTAEERERLLTVVGSVPAGKELN